MTSVSTSTKMTRPKSNTRAQSERGNIPASLNFWGRRSEDNAMNLGASPTFGAQQMRGYDVLDNMHRKGLPMQWADDERGRGKDGFNVKSASSIAFPTSSSSKSRDSHEGGARSDGSRFTSLPTRQHLQAPYRPPRYSIMTPRPALAEQNGNQIDQHKGRNSISSSGTSSPEGKVASLEPLNLRQRSIKSLRGIASAWVPQAVRTPYESENETTPTKTPKGKAKELAERRPIKLDRRRLNKAVSLAVEAAQASEQDQKMWKQKKRRQARQEALMKSAESSNNRFASLPWKTIIAAQHTDSDMDSKEGALVAYKHRGSLSNSENDDDEDEGDSDQVTKRAGVGLSSGSDDSEEDALPDDFSVDLYVSSLTYLLTALSPNDVENVGPRHREEMKRKLQEALRNLERKDDIPSIDSADREEVIRLRVERELAMMQQAYFQRQGMNSSSSRAHQAAQASSQQRNQKQSVAGYLASSAIDLGLSVGAGALAAASRGVASLVPLLTADAPSSTIKDTSFMEPTSIEEIPSDDEQQSKSLVLPASKITPPPSTDQEKARPMLTHSQWELTRTLAHSVASTMYNNLAAVAEQRKVEIPPGNAPSEMTMYDPSARGSVLSTLDKPDDDASDQLLLMAATLARNVKRSPLPSQVRALTSQVVSLIGALDERYSISKRSADVALRKTGQALYYVRKNDLHVKALRAVWAIIEASVAAIEAYRDEEEWKGDITLQRGIEARPASR